MEAQEKKSIGKQLKEQRDITKLSQKKLSELSGISLFTISSLEQERLTETSTHTLRSLSKHLNFYKFIL